MDILDYPNYKLPLDDGLLCTTHIISIGPAKDVEYYTTKQQQILNKEIYIYIYIYLKRTLKEIFIYKL